METLHNKLSSLTDEMDTTFSKLSFFVEALIKPEFIESLSEPSLEGYRFIAIHIRDELEKHIKRLDEIRIESIPEEEKAEINKFRKTAGIKLL